MLLLGSGAVGAVIAQHLVASRTIDHVEVGDIAVERAKVLVPRLGSKVTASQVNAGDKGELERALKGKDTVINAALPAYNLTIMGAALAKGVNYLDLAGGQEEQLKLHKAWERASLTAVLGVGEDPGISNVMARYAADGMDEVHEIRIRDGETGATDEYPFFCLFSPESFLEEATEHAVVFQDTKFQRLPPMANPEIYPFPEPVGPVPIVNMDHEEVHTLPNFIGKGLRFVDFKLAVLPEDAEVIRVIRRLGLMGQKPLDVAGAKVRPRDLLLSLIPPPGALAGKIKGNAIVLVEVRGRKDGMERVHTLWSAMDHQEASRRYGCTATSYLTGTGAAVGSLLVAEGTFATPGVFAPECMEAKPFLQALGERGVEVSESISFQRSWAGKPG